MVRDEKYIGSMIPLMSLKCMHRENTEKITKKLTVGHRKMRVFFKSVFSTFSAVIRYHICTNNFNFKN